MTIINLEATVKNLVAGLGLDLTSSQNNVNLTLNNSELAQILSQILQSNNSISVNYNSQTGRINFTTTANVTQGQLATLIATSIEPDEGLQVTYNPQTDKVSFSLLFVPPPDHILITNKNQFDANRNINILQNQNVILYATNDLDWDDQQTYNLVFPISFTGISNHLITVNDTLSISTSFATLNTDNNYLLNDINGIVFASGTTGSIKLYGQVFQLPIPM